MKYLVYEICKRCPFLKNTTLRIEAMMSVIYVNNRNKVKKITQNEMIKIIAIIAMVFTVMIFPGKLNISYVFMGTIIVYMIIDNRVYSKFDNAEIKLLKQFEKFIQDVRFKFKYDGMIEEAIEDAYQNCENEMSVQGEVMYKSLLRRNKADKKTSYTEIAPNHFFKTFYALCETVLYYGDKVVDNQSVFVKNIGYLKDDINVEILKRERIRALFMGLMTIIILPLIAIKPIEIWGVNNVSGLREFYYGINGETTIVFVTIVTAMIFKIVMKLKYPPEYDNNKSRFVEKLLDVKYVDKFIMWLIRRNYKYYYSQEDFLKSIVYKYNVKEFLVYRIGCSCFGFIVSNVLFVGIGINGLFGSKGMLIQLLCSITVAVAAYNFEYIMILIRKQMLKINREEEVVRFQSIILILMNMDRMSIESMLEWMENFAVVFRNDIEIITDSLSYKGIQVFEEAKDRISFLPMERLYDGFIASDRIGIKKAFSDVLSDRIYYIDKHKQENEIIIGNKAMIAKFLSFLPICMIIIFVLVVPFVIESLNQLNSFNY